MQNQIYIYQFSTFCFGLGLAIASRIQVIREIIIEYTTAVKKLLTSKPSSAESTSKIIPAFITRRKSPKVINVIGMVRITSIGLRKAFKKPSIKATRIAVGNPFRNTPGRIHAPKKTASDETSNLRRNLISSVLFNWTNLQKKAVL